MIEQDLPDVFGYTVFCDDIRQEANGKLIFIGVYPHEAMLVQGKFPLTLPRICFSILVAQKISSFLPTVGIQIFVPGDSSDAPSIVAEAGETVDGVVQDMADMNSNSFGIPESERTYIKIFANMQFENFLLKEEGLIKVRADVGGKRYKIGSLRVTKSPVPSDSPTSRI